MGCAVRCLVAKYIGAPRADMPGRKVKRAKSCIASAPDGASKYHLCLHRAVTWAAVLRAVAAVPAWRSPPLRQQVQECRRADRARPAPFPPARAAWHRARPHPVRLARLRLALRICGLTIEAGCLSCPRKICRALLQHGTEILRHGRISLQTPVPDLRGRHVTYSCNNGRSEK